MPTAKFRGKRSSWYAIDDLIARGYGIVTAYAGDFDPDWPDKFRNGVHGLLDDHTQRNGTAGAPSLLGPGA